MHVTALNVKKRCLLVVPSFCWCWRVLFYVAMGTSPLLSSLIHFAIVALTAYMFRCYAPR